MKLSVGIINSTPYWDELLKQIGISVKKISITDILLKEYPVIIVNEINSHEKDLLYSYMSGGGYVLTEASAAQKIFNISFKRKKIEYLYSNIDDLFNIPLYCELNCTLKIPANTNYLKCGDNNNTLLLKEFGAGAFIVLPDDFLKQIFSYKSKRKIFYSRWGKELPTEKVSAVDKRGIYNILHRVLEFLFHKKNLPFIKLWKFPKGIDNIFGFRIDTDFANDEDMLNLYSTLSENKINGTWFIETLSRENKIDIFDTFKDQEISLHCYQHKTYREEENNLRDIQKGVKILKDSGYSPVGYASPFGGWSPVIGSSIEKSGFKYSSEFGFIYDALPMHPIINNKITQVLQIPIHPLSVGRLNIAGHSTDDMVKYFLDLVEQKVKGYEPIILYTHPSQKRLDVFSKMFKTINELNILSLTFKEFSEWWNNRSLVKWDPEIKEKNIRTNAEIKYDSIYIHLSFNNGKNILSQINSKDLLSGREITPKQTELLPGFDPEIINKKSFKLFKQELIYNYRKLKH